MLWLRVLFGKLACKWASRLLLYTGRPCSRIKTNQSHPFVCPPWIDLTELNFLIKPPCKPRLSCFRLFPPPPPGHGCQSSYGKSFKTRPGNWPGIMIGLRVRWPGSTQKKEYFPWIFINGQSVIYFSKQFFYQTWSAAKVVLIWLSLVLLLSRSCLRLIPVLKISHSTPPHYIEKFSLHWKAAEIILLASLHPFLYFPPLFTHLL